MSTFVLKAAPGTDIWRKPPSKDIFNAPTGAPPGVASNRSPLSAFVSARASVSFLWTEQYDQGGLLLSFRRKGSDPAAPPQKWIKTGIEFYNGKPMLSTVSCDAWADWSVSPLTTSASDTSATAAAAKTWTTMLIQREQDGNGTGLWVYQVLDGGEKVPLREICWAFGDGSADDWEVEVLGMAARPAETATGELEVEVKDFEVTWST
ncbi:hypothetical protein GQ53DRAFT_33788 [Thozetella sp. PMI_491]|nr:hypothetical protein GQ53DRAFT_33788 [Thozetella sp. PMI_491]